jgi:hypothetical protein
MCMQNYVCELKCALPPMFINSVHNCDDNSVPAALASLLFITSNCVKFIIYYQNEKVTVSAPNFSLRRALGHGAARLMQYNVSP